MQAKAKREPPPKMKTCSACGVFCREKAKRCPMCNLSAFVAASGLANSRAEQQGARLARWESKNAK